MENKGLWKQMQDDKEPKKGDWGMNLLTDMMKNMVSTAPKVNVEDCVIEPYMVNEEGGTCWCIKAGNRVIAVSNKAGCEQVLKGWKDAKNRKTEEGSGYNDTENEGEVV